MKTALVVFSFGGDVGRIGEVNNRLASLAHKRWKISFQLLYAEGFVAEALKMRGFTPDFVVEKQEIIRIEEVVSVYAEQLRKKGVDLVYVLAHPFLHRYKCRKLLEKEGFKVGIVHTGWLPFDPQCSNWWARSPINLLWYTFLQMIFGR